MESAERHLTLVLQKAPDDHRALALMAEARLRTGRLNSAFDFYLRAVNVAPHVHLYKQRFLVLAAHGIDVPHSEQLETAIAACLKTPDLAGAVENWSRLLMANPDFQAIYAAATGPAFNPRDIELLCRPLFLEGMKSNVVCDPAFETFVAKLRRHLLHELTTRQGHFPKEAYVLLASAVSHYAFFTDFILDETQNEQQRVDELCRQIETDREAAINPAAVAVLACYRPLYGLANSDTVLATFKNCAILSDVVEAQIADHVALRRAEVSLTALAPLADETSLRVRDQYEEFPYPRWKTLSKRRVVEDWRNNELSRRLEAPMSKGPKRVLVVGCGTGRDAAIHAMRFPLSSIIAVDVSRTSLAYAALKAKEHGLVNITFLHGDILDLETRGGIFDHICCTGVLHHMKDPLAGWRVLCGLLRAGDLMRIGLYSRAGRRVVAAAQEAAKSHAPTREGLLRFRREYPGLCDRETLLGLSRLQDYYHLNMYRDLLFPAREHRFDLIQIKDILRTLGLTFEGFHLPADVLGKYRSIFRDDRSGTDLDSWQQFETRYPETFASMYIFWCRKAYATPEG